MDIIIHSKKPMLSTRVVLFYLKLNESFMITSNRYLCPDHVNPAEFLADLISIDYSSSESVYSSQKRIDALVESFSQRTSAVIYTTPLLKDGGFRRSMTFSKKTIVKRKGNWWRQFWLLLRRAWMQVTNFCYLYDLLGMLISGYVSIQR